MEGQLQNKEPPVVVLWGLASMPTIMYFRWGKMSKEDDEIRVHSSFWMNPLFIYMWLPWFVESSLIILPQILSHGCLLNSIRNWTFFNNLFEVTHQSVKTCCPFWLDGYRLLVYESYLVDRCVTVSVTLWSTICDHISSLKVWSSLVLDLEGSESSLGCCSFYWARPLLSLDPIRLGWIRASSTFLNTCNVDDLKPHCLGCFGLNKVTYYLNINPNMRLSFEPEP